MSPRGMRPNQRGLRASQRSPSASQEGRCTDIQMDGITWHTTLSPIRAAIQKANILNAYGWNVENLTLRSGLESHKHEHKMWRKF